MNGKPAAHAPPSVNPYALLTWSGAALTMTLLTTNPVTRLLLLLATANVTMALARPGAHLRAVARLLMVAGVIAVVLDLLLSHQGAHVLGRIPDGVPALGGPLTLEALLYGLDVAIGFAAAVLATAPLATTLEPHQLIDLLPAPLHRIGTVLAATANLVPGLGRSATAIRDAQRMRGWEPRGLRSWGEVLVPVTVTALEDSLQLAEAMEARGFGLARRTRFSTTRWTAADVVILTCSLAALAILLVARISGADTDWNPFPAVSPPAISPLSIVACALLLSPVALQGTLSADRPRGDAPQGEMG